MKKHLATTPAALTALLAFAYMVSYITRINFGAVISEMVSATGISKSLLSMSLTGSFITYGLGQVISGVLGDRFSPKKLVSAGLVLTVSMNLAVPFSASPYLMLFFWCINGFAQSLMWPPMVKMMTACMTPEEYKKNVVKVSWGCSAGTIFVYLFAPLAITLASWRWAFFLSASCGALMLFFWQAFAPEIGIIKRTVPAEKGKGSVLSILFCPVMLFVMLAIILQGMLRDGVTTWMPSYLAETYKLSNSISILTGVVMPLFAVLSNIASSEMYVKWLKNPVTCGGTFFLISTVSALGLYLFTGSSPALSVFFTAVLIAGMHGVNLLLVCMIPPFFERWGNVATASGVINSCTYVGSALSTYGIALVSDHFGWSLTLFLWLLTAALGTALCFLSAPSFRKRFF